MFHAYPNVQRSEVFELYLNAREGNDTIASRVVRLDVAITVEDFCSTYVLPRATNVDLSTHSSH